MNEMYEWHKNIQSIVDEMDGCIKRHEDEALTLHALSHKLGYSEYYTTRKFKEIAHMSFREYLRRRRLAFALIEVRDSERELLDIALDYGFSSHEAFTRAFKETYGMNPSEYRKNPIGGHDGIDWLVYNAFVESVREDLAPPIDTYDTATLMSIACLSEQSIAMGGAPVAIPDFTSGKWIERIEKGESKQGYYRLIK